MVTTVGLIKERAPGERRVALVPETVQKIIAAGWQVCIQQGAGEEAGFPDALYPEEVRFESSAATVIEVSDIVVGVKPLDHELLQQLTAKHVVVGMLEPYQNYSALQQAADAKAMLCSMEMIPRTTRAQAMDVLSSQAAVAGYKAVLMAASESPRFFPMLTTAAGTIRPSSVLVIGAGVAGLQAIATAKRLGANVTGYDIRPETAEQVKSLGAKFLDLGVNAVGEGGYARALTDEEKALQQKNLRDHLTKFEVLITTAAVPGRPAPKIITTDMIRGMPAGSVVIDLAAESGGNCEPTKAGESVLENGVTIHGPENVAASIPLHASEMYSRNIWNLLGLIQQEDSYHFDWEDDILAACTVVRDGQVDSNFKPSGDS